MVTPYGVVYSNGMKLEQVYDGQHFPAYLHQTPQLMIELKSGDRTVIQPFKRLHRHGITADGQGVDFADPLQIGEIGE